MEYKEFLQTKQKNHIVSGFNVDQSDLNSNLFPFQRFIVDRALKAGKYASPVWMDIDYGNTLQGFRNGREDNDEKHICPLQLDTIERLIHLYSNKGDTVFTPFMGIGSEVFQAVKMGRKGIGFELKESYFDLAKKNIASAVEMKKQLTLI